MRLDHRLLGMRVTSLVRDSFWISQQLLNGSYSPRTLNKHAYRRHIPQKCLLAGRIVRAVNRQRTGQRFVWNKRISISFRAKSRVRAAS